MYDKLDKYVRWCDSGWFPFSYGMVKSRKDFHKCLKAIEVKNHDLQHGNLESGAIAAHTSDFRDHNDNLLILVLVEQTEDERVKEWLVHEAVHIFQSMCEEIGEESPSKEFEAYGVQAITRSLWRAYEEVHKK